MKRIIISLLLMSFSANADIKKFMDRYCIDCHDEDIQKGDLRLDTFSFSKENFDKAQAVLEVLEAIEMPPKKKKRQPSLAERHEAMEILDQFLSAKSILNTKNMRKLTLREYTNTLNDTLKTNYDFSEIINPEEYGEHFNNLAKNQFASVNTLSNYIEAATLISKKTIVSDQPQVANILIKAKSLVSTAKDYVYDKQKKTVLITELKNNRGGLSLPNHKIAHDGRYKITFSAQSKSKVSKPVNIYKGVPTVFKTYVKVGELPILNKLRDYSIELDLEKGDQLIFNIPMNPKLSSKYKKGDKTLLEKIDVSSVRLDGPFYDSWPPIQTKQIFSNLDYRDPNNSKVAINQIIKTFIKKPLTPQQYALFYDSYKKEYTKTNSAQKALQKVMQSLLSSPAFLYRTEVSGQIDSYSLANRLSFFLWGTLADKVLLDDAKNNSLQNDGTLNNHIERMLNDSRTNRFLDDFTHQWLWLNKVGEMIPNRDLYGRYNDRIKELFIEETKAFVKEIFSQNLPISNFVESDFMMLNKELASFYGYKKLAKKNNLGSSFKKIALPEGDQRGGLMTQGAFLNMTTDGESTSPILRGVWILKNIYGAHLEPPAGIPTIEPDIRNTKTLKEIMAAHQAQSSCSRCHSKIDPLGVPFEHFDVVGKLRDKYAKVEVSYTKDEATKVFGKKSGPYVKLGYSPIDSKIKMASGVEVETPTEIKREMLKDMEVISKAFIKKLLSYGLGRDIIYSEQTHVDDIYKNSLAKGLGMKDIIRECVKSTIFKQH